MARRPVADKRVKLLVCIIKKGDETALTEACNECCAALSFSGLGYGTAKSHYMSYLGLDEIEKRVVYSLIPNYSETRVLRAINKRLKLYLGFRSFRRATKALPWNRELLKKFNQNFCRLVSTNLTSFWTGNAKAFSVGAKRKIREES